MEAGGLVSGDGGIGGIIVVAIVIEVGRIVLVTADETDKIVNAAKQDATVTDIYLNRSLSTITNHEVTP